METDGSLQLYQIKRCLVCIIVKFIQSISSINNAISYAILFYFHYDKKDGIS